MSKHDALPAWGLYRDARIGGRRPRYVITDRPEQLMRVPDSLRKCVAFIGYMMPTGEISLQGTVFFVSSRVEELGIAFIHVVTARHVIQGIESLGHDKVYLRINSKDGETHEIETILSNWLFHPEESEVDVAVLPFAITTVFNDENARVDHGLLDKSMFISDEFINRDKVGVGDEVFIVGLFAPHHGRQINIPIVRIGNIAAWTEERVRTKMGLIDAYLIEARSIGGLSGSPVFVNLGNVRVINGELRRSADPEGLFWLLGLLHGHYDETLTEADLATEDAASKRLVNMGIGIVVPIHKVAEVLNQPMIMDEEKRLTEIARAEQTPTMDSVDEGITREGFEEALRRASRKTASQPESEKSETSE